MPASPPSLGRYVRAALYEDTRLVVGLVFTPVLIGIGWISRGPSVGLVVGVAWLALHLVLFVAFIVGPAMWRRAHGKPIRDLRAEAKERAEQERTSWERDVETRRRLDELRRPPST